MQYWLLETSWWAVVTPARFKITNPSCSQSSWTKVHFGSAQTACLLYRRHPRALTRNARVSQILQNGNL